jgi:hypothetical protein
MSYEDYERRRRQRDIYRARYNAENYGLTGLFIQLCKWQTRRLYRQAASARSQAAVQQAEAAARVAEARAPEAPGAGAIEAARKRARTAKFGPDCDDYLAQQRAAEPALPAPPPPAVAAPAPEPPPDDRPAFGAVRQTRGGQTYSLWRW